MNATKYSNSSLVSHFFLQHLLLKIETFDFVQVSSKGTCSAVHVLPEHKNIYHRFYIVGTSQRGRGIYCLVCLERSVASQESSDQHAKN